MRFERGNGHIIDVQPAARGHICELYVYCKNSTLTDGVGYTTYKDM